MVKEADIATICDGGAVAGCTTACRSEEQQEKRDGIGDVDIRILVGVSRELKATESLVVDVLVAGRATGLGAWMPTFAQVPGLDWQGGIDNN